MRNMTLKYNICKYNCFKNYDTHGAFRQDVKVRVIICGKVLRNLISLSLNWRRNFSSDGVELNVAPALVARDDLVGSPIQVKTYCN
jgi:hypothetical protein